MSTSEISPLLFDSNQRTYERFRSIYAERTRGVVAWVGAGLSMEAGLPSWPALRDKLAEELEISAISLQYDQPKTAETKRNQAARIKSEKNLWRAFSMLTRDLGKASFEAAVRNTLTPPKNVSVPESYLRLWRLKIAGMLTLNLDGFAQRSAHIENPNQDVHVVVGRQAGESLTALTSGLPFVVNLHGVLDRTSTWIFTTQQIQGLLSAQSYRYFLSYIFTQYTVLFIGMSADDLSSGGFLGDMRWKGTDPGQHFWLTNRKDRETLKFAEKRGIQPILYTAIEYNHASPLNIFFDDLENYRPADEDASVVWPTHVWPNINNEELPPPNELRGTPEEIRKILANHAYRILQESENYEEAERKYQSFCSDYELPIHVAWFVSSKEKSNVFFDYKIIEEIGNGAFGDVYRAISPDGDKDVAIKILKKEIQGEMNVLGNFRRGVSSMRILSEQQVHGMVRYHDAFELPPSVVMDFIEGPNLKTAIERHDLNSWQEKLYVAKEIASIIREAHGVEKRVLHRDLRPPNIMLKPSESSDFGWEVVILDFDLSWYEGSVERSIEIKASAALGYLAPEQIERTNVTTRNAAVDSFGLGMTLRFLFTGKEPIPGEYRRENWSHDLRNEIAVVPCEEWNSIPNRVTRLIERATAEEQFRRIDMGVMSFELEKLYKASFDRSKVDSAELWTEELLWHASEELGSTYEWNPDRTEGYIDFQNGTLLFLKGLEVEHAIQLKINWISQGQRRKKSLHKYLQESMKKCKDAIKKACWAISESETTIGTGDLCIIAKTDVSRIYIDFESFVSMLVKVVGWLRQ